jgi:hypothetical protein
MKVAIYVAFAFIAGMLVANTLLLPAISDDPLYVPGIGAITCGVEKPIRVKAYCRTSLLQPAKG